MIKRFSCGSDGYSYEYEGGLYVLFTDHEADKQELSLAYKALGKKCTELEAARDYNAGLCEKLEQENGRLLKALHDISVVGLLSDEPDCPRSKRMREIAEKARKK